MRFSRTKSPIVTPYILCNHISDLHHHNPYLGVPLIEDTKWGQHINSICKKASSTLHFLQCNLFNCHKERKELANISLVRSKLEYVACVLTQIW